MFRTKKDVDRHVQDIFRKLKDENERTLRCFKIAELYYHVCDFESARRYLSRYVEVRQEAKAHKLMGQILEALGQKEISLIQYKYAFELGFKQEDIILKICELMADPEVKIDINRAKHWTDRAEKLFPQDKVVFQLKEKILSIERPTNNEDDLEKLITSELAVRKKDVQLRIKLLRHYMEKNKFDEAYKHATEIEVSNIHRDSLLWYQVLCELFLKCKGQKQSSWSFWILYISSIERYAVLSLKEQGSSVKKTSEAIQAVYNFDQLLYEAKGQSFSRYQSLTESIFMHMWGQLHFHMACLLLQNTKREQSSWTETGRLCTPLLLTAMHITPINIAVFKNVQLDSSIKSQLDIWYREGCYRCSQAGHVLQEYSRGNQKMLITNIEKFCTGPWRECVYQRIFVGNIYQKIRTSYFTNNNATNPPLRLMSQNELGKYNEVAEEVWPYSLHHQIWPAIKSRNGTGLHPNLSSHLFPELQFSVYNLNQASPVTLCRLDIDAFLNAAVLCATAIVEEQHRNNLFNPDRLPTLPADLINPFCTEDQQKWWSAAYKMYRKEALDDIGNIRQNLQRGLEVIRCIGNHGLHPTILVHLARIFHYRAKQLKKKNSENGNIFALESRSELYWSAVIPLLERLQNNQTIRYSSAKLFNYIGKDMNNMELTHAIEEGKLLLAHKLLRDNLYEQAIVALQELKCPEASFEQGKIYKRLADENINCLSTENLNSDTTNEHKILLLKARNCFYLTLDRLRSPGADPKHRLNAEIHTYINMVENELPKFDQDILYSDSNQNNYDEFSEESYSSAQSDEQPIVNNSLTTFNNSSLQTPMRSVRRVSKIASTPRQKSQDMLDISQNRHEARPSPERLDAQIRQLVHSIESLKEQNREQQKILVSKLDELIRISVRKENQKSHPQKLAINRNLEEDLYGLYGEEDYRDFNNYSSTSIPTVSGSRSSTGLAPNLFAAATPRHPYSPLIYPSPAANAAAALQGYYQGGPLTFPDPGATAAAAAAAAASQHMSALYPAGVYSMSSLYRSGLEQPIPSMQQMTESALQHSLFAQRLAGQLPDYLQPQSQNLSAQQQIGQQLGQIHMNDPKFSGYVPTSEGTVTESINLKDNVTTPIPTSASAQAPAPVPTPVPVSVSGTVLTTRKVPPVNVVITTSDTLPTTVPTVQPMLSVTIPAQHRLGVSPVTMMQDPNSIPHGYQISMPSQPTILTTVNLPPLATTITTTSPIIKSHVTDKQNTSILSTDSHHSGSDAAEVEHDPIPDFTPIVPLPDEVPVTTGEEDEETLFSGRAKLFRFADKEWKERGVGTVKLLRNASGKVRLLMRREQVHKICANHMLRRDMEITMMPNNDRAYVWVANDFADEELKLEKLCIRFKTAEEAGNFKDNFDKAKNSLPPNSENTTSTEKPVLKPAKIAVNDKKPVEKIGGFSFTSVPIIQNLASTETPDSTQKKFEEAVKPSPFASLSFVKPPETNATTSGGFSFNSPTVTANQLTTFGQDPSKVTLRRSHVTAPVKSLKENEKDNVEDDEVVIIEQGVNFMFLAPDTKSWREKSSGQFTVLSHKSTERIRFLVTKENSKKIMYNQIIPTTTVFILRHDILTWTIGSDKVTSETYAARFKSSDQASSFHKTLTAHLQKSPKLINKPVITGQKSLSEMFKPPTGSWECKDCYTRNNASAISCVACQGPSPNAGKAATTVTPLATKPLSQMFKVPGSWECIQCSVINNQSDEHCSACEFSKDLSIESKPKLGNKFLKDFEASETKTTFTFGIPQNTQQTPSKETLGFNFGQSAKSSEKAVSSPICIFGTNKVDNAGTSGFIFGTQTPSTPISGDNDESFIFGSPGKSFDFQFQTKSPPVKSPERPETSDEEVVEEAEDVYFAPVIPLPDKVDVKTGEENEDILYNHRAKLFKYDSISKEWKERGLGDIKLLKHKDTKKLRLVMRRNQVLKLCLNHAVTAGLEITPKDEKTWMWSAGDYSEGEVEYMQLACRFKTSEIAKEFKKIVDDACKCTGFDSSEIKERKESSPDIQIVYELKVSADEKAAALKLQLPENFYAYKYKDDCPGCVGCQDLDESTFETSQTNQPSATAKVSQPTFGSRANDVLPPTTSPFSLNNVFGKPTTIPITTQSDSALKMIFGTSTKPIFGDGAKSTDFVFGSQVPTKPTDFQETGLDHLKICCVTTKPQPSSGLTTTTTNFFTGFGTTVTSGTSIIPAKTLFGGTSVAVSDLSKSPATPVFGNLLFSGISTNAPTTSSDNTKSIVFGQPKLSTTNIFGGSKPSTANIFGGTPNLGTTMASTTTTTTTTSILSSTGSIFGHSTATKTLFGGQTSVTPTFDSVAVEGMAQPSPFGTFGSGLFGKTITSSLNAKTTTSTTPTTTTSAFSSDPSNQFASKIIFGNSIAPSTNNIFTNTSTQPSNIFDTKPSAEDSKKDGISFLPTENALSFSTLNTQNASKENAGFKIDPNFRFDGAGSSVFGSKSSQRIAKASSKNSSNTKKDKIKNDDDEEGDEENENGDEHDPYFEPIIPLPDAIEVRTGEEDEEKVFCERARLYRYDDKLKEWKERGIGEIKLLHNTEHGTFRLLMRREQVHKVVCNFLLTPDVEFCKLNSSDRAWVWAGMNHVDPDKPEVEKLAIKFKSPEMRNQFKLHIDIAQKALVEKQNQDLKSVYEDNEQDDDYNDIYTENFDGDEDEAEDEEDEEEEEKEEEEEDDDDNDDDDDDNDEDDDDDDDDDDDNDNEDGRYFERWLMLNRLDNEDSEDNVIVIENEATFSERNPADYTSMLEVPGNIKIMVDGTDFRKTRIIFENNQNQVISNTVVTADVDIQNFQYELAWLAVDNALQPAKKRVLKFKFASISTAQQVYKIFKRARKHAKKWGIRE